MSAPASGIRGSRRRLASFAVAGGAFLLLLCGFQLSSPSAALPLLRRIFVEVAAPEALIAEHHQELRRAAESAAGGEVLLPSVPLVVSLSAVEVRSTDADGLAELLTRRAARRLYERGLPDEATLGGDRREVVVPGAVRPWLEVLLLLLNRTTHRLLGVVLGVTSVLLLVAAWSLVRGGSLAEGFRALGLGLALGVVPLVVGGWLAELSLERAADVATDAGTVAAVGWVQAALGAARDVLRPFLGLTVVLLLCAWLARASWRGRAANGEVTSGC